MNCHHRIEHSPSRYDQVSKEKMEKAGLVLIVDLFEHNHAFTSGSYVGTEYHFENGKVITDMGKFREKVYGK